MSAGGIDWVDLASTEGLRMPPAATLCRMVTGAVDTHRLSVSDFKNIYQEC
jgi:hypothetical protein